MNREELKSRVDELMAKFEREEIDREMYVDQMFELLTLARRDTVQTIAPSEHAN